MKPAFTIRGKELYRIEALSDAVFAFSVSLLVASLEVPQTFMELKTIIAGALPFFTTVALLFLLWYQQYNFFRHYGLNDLKTILLNLIYLALIIFYLYPLKFMFSLLLGSWTGIDFFPKARIKNEAVIEQHDFYLVIILFSVGYAAIWFLLFLMHRHAAKQAAAIQLSPAEKAYTAREIRGALLNVILGILGILLALFNWVTFAGLIYFLIPVILLINDRIYRRQKQTVHT